MRLDLMLPGAALSEDAGRAEVSLLTARSGEARPGALFAALPGRRADGRDHVPEALRRGASAVLAPAGFALPPGARAALATHPDPRRALAQAAARLHGPPPEALVAATGTDGKTSVAWKTRALLRAASGEEVGLVGTLGAACGGALDSGMSGGLTTPEPVALARLLAEMRRAGARAAALEASSHGLAQSRLDGLRLRAACFTGLGRDHADFHGTRAAYFAAKRRLFLELLERGAVASLAAGRGGSEALRAALALRRPDLRVLEHGARARDLSLEGFEFRPGGCRARVRLLGREMEAEAPLLVPFQVENLLGALALALAARGAEDGAAEALLRGVLEADGGAALAVPGRLERVAAPRGSRLERAEILVDYAHNPNGVEGVLSALAERARALGRPAPAAVLGAGGERDEGKRPMMGAAAARFASAVVVCDDNPRGEDPARIRAAVLAGARAEPGGAPAREVGCRREAIAAALAALPPDGTLAVLGRGHEAVQETAAGPVPFSDRAVVAEALEAAP